RHRVDSRLAAPRSGPIYPAGGPGTLPGGGVGTGPPLASAGIRRDGMSLSRRLLIAAACLALGVAAQVALVLHLARAPASPYPELRKALAACPAELRPTAPDESASATAASTVWRGGNLPGLDALRAKLPFEPHDLLSRGYQAVPSGPVVNLYMVHSRTA